MLCPVYIFCEPAAQRPREDFFIAPLTEVILYGIEIPAFGGGFAVGYGTGTAIGLRLLYTLDVDNINMLEMVVFLRYYIFGAQAYYGPFVQLLAGTAIFTRYSTVYLPTGVGSFSIGLAAGWRFFFAGGERFFLEGAIRAGFPYYIGTGLSIGTRF